MKDLDYWTKRLSQSTVVWSWILSGLRLAGGLLLLPIILRVFSREDLGMYYAFLNLYALLPVLDFGFSVSICRYVSYAMGGAAELQPQGLVGTSANTGSPNFDLLWQLLFTTRKLFRYLSGLAFILVGVVGTWIVSLRVNETTDPSVTWLAWAVMLLSIVLEIYAGWWNHFLRGMNEVLLSARISVLSFGLRFILAAVFLLAGGGLLAFPVAGLIGSLVQRQLSRKRCLQLMGASPLNLAQARTSLLRILWPNSWRAGLQFLSSYLAGSANALICLKVLGLVANGEYGLSVQVAQMIAGMASVWIFVKWPLVAQLRTQQNYAGIRALLWPRTWLQMGSYILMAVAAFFLGPALLKWLGTNKQLLPMSWFALLLVNSFLEMRFSFWTTLLSIENRIPSLWPTVASNIVSMILVLLLLHFSSLSIGSFILAPFVAYSLFSYWYWPGAGARSLQTTWGRFMLFGDRGTAQLQEEAAKTSRVLV